jgi:peptide/nickel transport system permease protein
MMGIRGFRLLFGHILPLCLPSAIVRLALDLAGIILAAAGLGSSAWAHARRWRNGEP